MCVCVSVSRERERERERESTRGEDGTTRAKAGKRTLDLEIHYVL